MTHLLGQPLEYRDLRRTSMLKESGIPTRSAAFLRLKQRLCSMRRHRSKESQAFLLLKQRLSSTRRYPKESRGARARNTSAALRTLFRLDALNFMTSSAYRRLYSSHPAWPPRRTHGRVDIGTPSAWGALHPCLATLARGGSCCSCVRGEKTGERRNERGERRNEKRKSGEKTRGGRR